MSTQMGSIPRLLAVASRLEGEGQYNNAKLVRAATESILHQAAFHAAVPFSKDILARELENVAGLLSEEGMSSSLVEAIEAGASALSEDRLPLIHETPNASVCRTCGYVVTEEQEQRCPTCGARRITFKRFLPIYWLEAQDPFSALQSLQHTPTEVSALVDGLSEAQLAQQPEAGGWAIRNIVSHLRDAQGVLSFRLDLMLEQDNPPIESKAVFEWATREEDRPPTTLEIFDTYRNSRQKTIEKLEAISLRDWWRQGRHEEFGTVTILQQVSYFATHEITHLPQIELLRQGLLSSA
ncbi:MAG: DUF664 domain-containing protein [Anaerolineales bacterium]|nr:DUF664 domain-containing protein [Anaerolineales bacterium]